jgi:hypothetical protein
MSGAVGWLRLSLARDTCLHRRIGHARLTAVVTRVQARYALLFETLLPTRNGMVGAVVCSASMMRL